jgi:hypothetical protein
VVWVILLLLLWLISTFLFIAVKEIVSGVLDIIYLLKRTNWKKSNALEEYIQNEFPIGNEFIFVGRYISHWEMGGFEWFLDEHLSREWNTRIMCELDIPFEGGWDWRKESLGHPTTREGWYGRFDLTFRGKIVEQGYFGHMGMCTYRIEVIEILSAKQLTV